MYRSALGLAKLFMLPLPQLRDVTVKGDLIISDTNRDSECIHSVQL